MNTPAKNEYLREWREANPDKTRTYHATYMAKYVRDRVDAWEEHLKTLSCERCGFDDFRVLTFHHRDPADKSFAIGYGVRRFSQEKLLAEAAKCEVLCANCHAIEHYRNLPQTPADRRVA
jgi:hypothetical protein